MGDYHDQRGGQFGGPPPPGKRDAAYNDIFGAPLPPGRSQTSTGSSQQPMRQQLNDDRTQTMSSMNSDVQGTGQRMPLPLRRPPPQDGYADGSVPSPRNYQQQWGPSSSGRQAMSGHGMGPDMSPRVPPNNNNYNSYSPNSGYAPRNPNYAPRNPNYAPRNPNYAPRNPSGGYPPQHNQQQQQQPYQQQPYQQHQQYQHQQQQQQLGSYAANNSVPQWRHYAQDNLPQGPVQNRAMMGGLPQGGPNDGRSQSLASMPRPQIPGGGGGRGGSSMGPFRGPPYQFSSTTPHGRHIPLRNEGLRHDDHRSMSLSGYPSGSRTISSGRVIPDRIPNNPVLPLSGSGYVGHQSNNSGGSGGGNYAHGGFTMTGAQARTASMTSSVSGADRTMSMASASTPITSEADRSALVHRPSTRSADSERPPTARIRAPVVYPALLSRVAWYFRRKIQPGDRVKHELTYHHAFSGQEAVDVLSYCIRTTDRNLALLLGRALDAQKFFHDVTYEHRLRDSPNEMYQFRETMVEDEDNKTSPAVNGVFLLLSDCYSPTCTRDRLCYSIACPRRLEQMSRLNLKPQPGLRDDAVNIGGDDADLTDEQKLWINSVPREVADSVGERERKRQEVLSEICYTERDFVKDLEYLRDIWINPLRSKHSPIPAQRRDKVTKTIFSNIVDPPSLHAVSSRFAKALTERQQKEPVLRNIADIFIEMVPQFQPFIHYGSKQLEGKSAFENERATNPLFARFVDEKERLKESRKLELNGYLTKPTTRLARYPLLLENVLKYTEDDNPDKEDIPKALVLLREVLAKVNAESGRAENRFNLRRLHQQLQFRPHEKVDLRLADEGRELVLKTTFKKSPTDPPDITAFLFDHAVLLARIKIQAKTEETTTKAYKRPIPLELLMIPQMEEVIPQGGSVKRSTASLIPLGKNADAKKSGEWPLTFKHLGRNGYELTLWAPNQPQRKKWLESVDAEQRKIRARADFFATSVVSSGFFVGTNKVNCVVPFDAGRRLLYGTDNGLYVSDRKAKGQLPRKVLESTNVTQVDVLEEYGLLLVLANKSLVSYPLSTLEQAEGNMSGRPKKIQNHCSYFRTGICLGRHLVAVLKSHATSTTVKVFEPNDAMLSYKKQKGIGRFISSGQDELKPFKEFYIPTESSSVHFLKSKLCVACSRGFEVVSLETLETQSLLDQADTSLDFVARKESVRPLHIERLNGEFLLSYSDFSFFVNRNGWRARPDWRIDWEGTPTAFALSFPWFLGFDASFIEVRNIDNGAVHIVPHTNIRMLHTSSHEILFAYEDENGDDVVESLDFWAAKNHRKTELPPALPMRSEDVSLNPGR